MINVKLMVDTIFFNRSDVPKLRAKVNTSIKKHSMKLTINFKVTSLDPKINQLKHYKKVIFISGGLHFGDILAKRMPDSKDYRQSQSLYKVVASGVRRK